MARIGADAAAAAAAAAPSGLPLAASLPPEEASSLRGCIVEKIAASLSPHGGSAVQVCQGGVLSLNRALQFQHYDCDAGAASGMLEALMLHLKTERLGPTLEKIQKFESQPVLRSVGMDLFLTESQMILHCIQHLLRC